MSEITQADHKAAAQHGLWLLDDEREALVEAFARHRLAERAKIVAWLRGFATNYADDLADILEADKTFTHPDNV